MDSRVTPVDEQPSPSHANASQFPSPALLFAPPLSDTGQVFDGISLRPGSLNHTPDHPEYSTPRLGTLVQSRPFRGDTANDEGVAGETSTNRQEWEGQGYDQELHDSQGMDKVGGESFRKRGSDSGLRDVGRASWRQKNKDKGEDTEDTLRADVDGFRIQRRASSKVFTNLRVGRLSRKHSVAYSLFMSGKRFIVDPESFGYYIWQNATPFMALFSTYVSPFLIAFTDWTSNKIGVVQYIAYSIDLFFFMDMVLASRVAYYNTAGDRLVTSSWKILARYLRRRFWFDFAMNFPLMEMVIFMWDEDKPIRFHVGLMVLLRLLRWEKIYQFLIGLNLNTGVSYFGITIIKLILLLTLVAHWSGCGLFFAAKLQDFSEDTWVGRFQPELKDAGTYNQYITSVYWAMTTMTTVGYGDFAAVNVYERAFCMTIMLINLGLTAYILGNMTLILTKSDSITAQFRDTVAKVNKYFTAKSIPEEIRAAAIAHMQLSYDVAEQRDEILDHCPNFIRRQVLKHLYQDHLASSYVFAGCEEAFLDKLVSHAGVDFYFPGAQVQVQDDVADCINFIISGTGRALDNCGRCIFVVREGMCFAEECVVCNIPAVWAIETRSYMKVLQIKQIYFKEACAMYPHEQRACARNVLGHLQSMAEEEEDCRLQNLFLQAETNLHRQRMDTVTKLCYLAGMNSVAELRRLVKSDKKLDPNSADYNKRTPLHLAAMNGSLEAVKFLIGEAGADPNAKDMFHTTPLQEATIHGHDNVMEYLMRHGAKLQLEDAGSMLCNTVYRGNLPKLERLLKAGADPNVCDYDQRTPLHICCADGLLPMVRVLVQKKGNIHSKDRWGVTPLAEAKRNSHKHIVELLERACADTGGSTERALENAISDVFRAG